MSKYKYTVNTEEYKCRRFNKSGASFFEFKCRHNSQQSLQITNLHNRYRFSCQHRFIHNTWSPQQQQITWYQSVILRSSCNSTKSKSSSTQNDQKIIVHVYEMRTVHTFDESFFTYAIIFQSIPNKSISLQIYIQGNFSQLQYMSTVGFPLKIDYAS